MISHLIRLWPLLQAALVARNGYTENVTAQGAGNGICAGNCSRF